MALPSNGTIALSDIKTEFGYLNRGNNLRSYIVLPTLPQTGDLKISDFYGKSSVGLYELTVGQNSTASTIGYIDGSYGSLNAVHPFGGIPGVSITRFTWATSKKFNLYVVGQVSNSGWNNLYIDNAFKVTRTSGGYTGVSSSNESRWSWSPWPGDAGGANPFPPAGQKCLVYFEI